MTKHLPWLVAGLLLLLVAAGVVALWFATTTEEVPAPVVPPQEVPRTIVVPSVAPEPRDEPRDVTRNTVSPKREEGTVKDTVDRFSGQLQYCYEKQLAKNPTLQGRVEVGWSIAGGAVSGTPSIVSNTTGDAALAECISAKIRRWRFPAGTDGDVSWPFVFQTKK